MSFKSHAIKAQALLGAKDHVAAVERDPRNYCGRAWESRNRVAPSTYVRIGCLLTCAVWAVEGPEVVVNDWGMVSAALGLDEDEVRLVTNKYDYRFYCPRPFERMYLTPVVNCARAAYDALESIRVDGD